MNIGEHLIRVPRIIIQFLPPIVRYMLRRSGAEPWEDGQWFKGPSMKRLVVITGLMVVSSTAAYADLGGAEIESAEPNAKSTMSGRVFDAKCGAKNIDCKIRFSEERFIVDKGSGITAAQLIDVKSEKVHTGNWISTWHYHSYNFKCASSSGEEREGAFRFYNDKVNEAFKRDLKIWTKRNSRIKNITTREYQANPEAAIRAKEAAASMGETINRMRPVKVEVEIRKSPEVMPIYQPYPVYIPSQ